MGRIGFSFKLDQFQVRRRNDPDSPDEPYLVPIYARIDGRILDPAVPVDRRSITLHFPDLVGHGNLGPLSKDMSPSGRSRVNVPLKIGRWESVLETQHMDTSVDAMRNCMAVLGLAFMEEDATADSTIKVVLHEFRRQAQRTIDNILRIFLGATPALPDNSPWTAQMLAQLETFRQELNQSGVDPNGIVSGATIMSRVTERVLPSLAWEAIGKALIPGASLGFLISGLAQVADRDDYAGADWITVRFTDLVGHSHEPMRFTLESRLFRRVMTWGDPPFRDERDMSEGLYEVTGSIRRTDSDEVPIVASVRGPEQQVTLIARSLTTNQFERWRSNDLGKTYKYVAAGTFADATFKSGPGAASSGDGSIQCVAGLGQDDEIYFNYSTSGGSRWRGWTRVTARRKFKSGPGVAMSADGDAIYLVARGSDDSVWFNRSLDRGTSWEQWRRIGNGVAHSSPALVRVQGAPRRNAPNFDALVVAVLGQDKRVWTARFMPEANLDSQPWGPVRTGVEHSPTERFTSAPAMTFLGGDRIELVCRASDLRYYRANSFDGGREFLVGTSWIPIGRPGLGRVRYRNGNERRGDLQAMYSAPSIVRTSNADHWVIAGLSPTLGLWHNRCSRHADAVWHAIVQEPEPALRMHYY